LGIICSSPSCWLVIPFYFTLGKCGFIFKPPFSVVVSVNVYVPEDRVTNLHQGYCYMPQTLTPLTMSLEQGRGMNLNRALAGNFKSPNAPFHFLN
jgi:hypothetical protein